MTTIGDSFSIVALLIGIGLTAWALVLSFALLLPRHSAASRTAFEAGLGKTFWLGVLGLIPLFTGIAILNAPAPPVKLLGFAMFLGMFAISMLGLSGLGSLVAGRIRAMEPSISVYGSLGRATGLLVVGGFFPFLGWFLVAPLLVVLGMGAGMRSLRSKATEASWELK